MGAASSAELSPMLERSLGEAIMSQGRRDPYVDDTELSQYLTTMGTQAGHVFAGRRARSGNVRRAGSRDQCLRHAWRLHGVNTGLIVASASESELAAVLAHEIGHVVQRPSPVA